MKPDFSQFGERVLPCDKVNIMWNRDWGYSSLTEHLSRISETLCLIPRTTQILLSLLVSLASLIQPKITEGISTEGLSISDW